MLSRERLGVTLLLWAFLTMFIVLALVVAVAHTRINQISNQTCGSVGGRWTETTDQFICVIEKE